MRLGNAHRQVAEARCFIGAELPLSLRGVRHIFCAVNLGGNCGNFFFQRGLVWIQQSKIARFVSSLFHDFG